jgi:hypothetical protein
VCLLVGNLDVIVKPETPRLSRDKLLFKLFLCTLKRTNDHTSRNWVNLVAYTATKANFMQQETSLETPVISKNDRPTAPDVSLTIKPLYKAVILKAVTHKSKPLLERTA